MDQSYLVSTIDIRKILNGTLLFSFPQVLFPTNKKDTNTKTPPSFTINF